MAVTHKYHRQHGETKELVLAGKMVNTIFPGLCKYFLGLADVKAC